MLLFFFSCVKADPTEQSIPVAYRITKSITYNNINVDIVIDKPALNEVDVLLVFHGTVMYDNGIMTAANTTLDKFKSILDRNDMMVVSVAYPQENVLFGDNIVQGEAALLWLKNKANQELGITVKKKVATLGSNPSNFLSRNFSTFCAFTAITPGNPNNFQPALLRLPP